MDFSNKRVKINHINVVRTQSMLFRAIGFLPVAVLPIVLNLHLAKNLFTLVLASDTFSQIPLIPLVSLFFIYLNRRVVFSDLSFGWVLGASLITPGALAVATARFNMWQLILPNQVSLFTFGIVLIWIGAFALFLGTRAFRAACFPLLFLVFTIPIPEPLLSNLIAWLQNGSADVAEEFFRLGGVPYLRKDLVFDLPGVAIQVAEECSGIRSTLALLVTAVLASHLFLKTTWKRILLCLAVIPLAILKNGLRIMTLSALAVYVNPGFLHGNLHHHGGVVFFVLALVPLGLLMIWLQKSEYPKTPPAPEGARAQF